jgi:hypothetical protein
MKVKPVTKTSQPLLNEILFAKKRKRDEEDADAAIKVATGPLRGARRSPMKYRAADLQQKKKEGTENVVTS